MTLNQLKVRPGGGNWDVCRSVVNAYRMITNSGKYKNSSAPSEAIRKLIGDLCSECIERSQAARYDQIHAHYQHRHDGKRCSQGNVASGRLQGENRRSDEKTRIANHCRNDEIAESQRKREDRTGYHSRKR